MAKISFQAVGTLFTAVLIVMLSISWIDLIAIIMDRTRFFDFFVAQIIYTAILTALAVGAVLLFKGSEKTPEGVNEGRNQGLQGFASQEIPP